MRPAVLVILMTVSCLRAASSLMECVADAWFAPGAKPDGSSLTLQLDRPDAAILLAFRTAAIEGWKVEKAVIVLHLAAPSAPVEVSVSLTGAPWRESSLEPPPFRDTSLAMEKTKPDGWISIPVPPALVQAVVDGKATGFALGSAHGGQTFHSRETIQWSPYLAVIGQPRSR